MQTFWTAPLVGDDKAKMQAEVRSARIVLETLQQHLEKEANRIKADIVSDEFMDKPNLHERMIKALARESELRRIVRLLDI